MDFRRLGLSISEVGASVTYGEAAALVRELARRWDSHYTAAVEEWTYVSTYGEVLAASHFEAYMNAHRDEKKHPQPFVAPRPWADDSQAPTVTEDELAVLVAKLESKSAFRDR